MHVKHLAVVSTHRSHGLYQIGQGDPLAVSAPEKVVRFHSLLPICAAANIAESREQGPPPSDRHMKFVAHPRCIRATPFSFSQ